MCSFRCIEHCWELRSSYPRSPTPLTEELVSQSRTGVQRQGGEARWQRGKGEEDRSRRERAPSDRRSGIGTGAEQERRRRPAGAPPQAPCTAQRPAALMCPQIGEGCFAFVYLGKNLLAVATQRRLIFVTIRWDSGDNEQVGGSFSWPSAVWW